METTTVTKQILFDSSFITIKYDEANNWIYTNWKGVQTIDTIKQGCEQILLAIKSKGCHKVLNDNTNVKGTWTHAREWVADHWFPRVIKAGLRELAYVYSPDVFSKFSTDSLLKRTDTNSFKSATFNSLEEGANWLRSI